MKGRSMFVLAVFALLTVAWGQSQVQIYDESEQMTLIKILHRLDRIESRLDAKPKATGLTWSVEQGDNWGTSWTMAGEPTRIKTGTAWYLFVVQGSRKFRVCKLEAVTP